MTGSGNTTVPSSPEDTSPPRPGSHSIPGLVCVWSRHQPRLVGQIIPLDPAIRAEWIMGSDERVDSNLAARTRTFRQRPGRLTPGDPITGQSISREQLAFTVSLHSFSVRNIGKEQAFVSGAPVSKDKPTLLAVGDVVLLRRHSAWLVVRRPAEMPPVPAYVLGTHAYGEPDADGIVGESPGAWAMRLAAAKAGQSNRHAFLSGESGSGKELLAKSIHRHSGRTGAYIAANGATIPESIMELELFGCAKDYPNPRSPARPGYVGRTERNGTFFLDEFGQLTEDMQARLLRLLQNESTRLGDSEPHSVDVLFIAATNKVGYGVKHDVFKRFPHLIMLLPLRERREDIPLIAQELVRREAREHPGTAARFLRRDPDGYEYAALSAGLVLEMIKLPLDGNVRDIENLLIVAMTETKARAEADGDMDGPLTVELPADMSRWQKPAPPPALPRPDDSKTTLDETDSLLAGYDSDRTKIVAALERSGWNAVLAAKHLDMTREQLKYRMKKLHIKRPGTE